MGLGTKEKENGLQPIKTRINPAPPFLLKVVRNNCKTTTKNYLVVNVPVEGMVLPASQHAVTVEELCPLIDKNKAVKMA